MEGERWLSFMEVFQNGTLELNGFSFKRKYTQSAILLNMSVLHYSNKAKKTDVAVVLDITELSTVFAY